MKNHTVTVDYFELHQAPIGFRDMTTPQASSLGFRGWAEAGKQGKMMQGKPHSMLKTALRLIQKEGRTKVA